MSPRLTGAVAMLISGALIMGYAAAATFFFTFWRRSSDRLFAFFAASFTILAVQRLFLALSEDVQGNAPWLYGLRLIAFTMILVAILDKNRGSSR